MRLTNLVEGRLLRRYKRFLADVELACGTEVLVHCPNPGSMLGVCQPGSRIFMARAREGRKLAYSWQFIETEGSMVMVDTMLANKLFAEAFAAGRLDELSKYNLARPEYKYQDSRFDFYLEGKGAKALLEVKSTTLLCGRDFRAKSDFVLAPRDRQDSVAYFPDARTERGLKHLKTLSEARVSGQFDETVQYYIVSRQDASLFRPCQAIDPAYAEGLRQAARSRVLVFARKLSFALERDKSGDFAIEVELADRVPVDLDPQN